MDVAGSPCQVHAVDYVEPYSSEYCVEVALVSCRSSAAQCSRM